MQKRNPSPIVNSVQDIFKDIKRIPRNIANFFNRWFTSLKGTEKLIITVGTMVVAYGSIFVLIKYDEYLVAKELEKCDQLLHKDYPEAYGSEDLRKIIAEGKHYDCVRPIIYEGYLD